MKGLHRLTFGLALLAALTGATPASAQDDTTRDAILLRRTLLLTPTEMLGQSTAPEVRVELQIDARGRVTDARALSITPSSELDDILREHVRTSLGGWRFAPALREGEPVPSSIELMVQYRAFANSPREAVRTASETFFFGDPGRQRSEVMQKPFEWRKETIDRYAETARQATDEGTLRRTDSPRFVIFTDTSDDEIGEILANNLEVTYGLFQQILEPALEPQPERYKMVAFVYSSRAAFANARAALRATSTADGFYLAPGFFAFHREIVDPDELLGLMIHETFHAFSDRKLRRPRSTPLYWLEEGLAEYFGNSQVKKGTLVPGRTIRRKFLMHYGQVFKRQTEAGLSLQQLRQALRRGETPPLESLASMSHQEFYGEDHSLHYGLAWLLVHYLRHGEDSWAESRFPSLLLYLYEGYDTVAALERTYGLTPAEVQEQLLDYSGRL